MHRINVNRVGIRYITAKNAQACQYAQVAPQDMLSTQLKIVYIVIILSQTVNYAAVTQLATNAIQDILYKQTRASLLHGITIASHNQ